MAGSSGATPFPGSLEVRRRRHQVKDSRPWRARSCAVVRGCPATFTPHSAESWVFHRRRRPGLRGRRTGVRGGMEAWRPVSDLCRGLAGGRVTPLSLCTGLPSESFLPSTLSLPFPVLPFPGHLTGSPLPDPSQIRQKPAGSPRLQWKTQAIRRVTPICQGHPILQGHPIRQGHPGLPGSPHHGRVTPSRQGHPSRDLLLTPAASLRM